MKSLIRELNGYRLIYEPSHPKAMKSQNWEGYVYEHIVVAEKFLGRNLRENEEVHHLDENRANNRQENLLVLEDSQHHKLHGWLTYGSQRKKPEYCLICGKVIQGEAASYCSYECCKFAFRVTQRPSKEVLQNEINSMSLLQVGKKYGVSDNAIRKWMKSYNITKGP